MTLEIRNPAKPATVVATYASTDAGEIDSIIAKAKTAQATWKDIPQPEARPSAKALPFIGTKDSALGVGGSNGPSVMQFYTSEHTVYRKGQA